MEETKKQTYSFQTEVKQILQLMINSLYSNKEIFLRELVSNASDAIEKLKFAALSDSSLYGDDSDTKIWVEFDADANTVTVRDNGIGMDKDELIKNLGTIAKSGTKEFFASLSKNKDENSKLIGQFGVGFYSSFIVANKVEVVSKKAKSEEAYKWVSAGEGDFSIEQVEAKSRGTSITLHLKEGESEFLNDWRLRNIITKYADHLTVPVVMKKQETASVEQDESESPEKKEDDATVEVEEVVNKATALWSRPKSEITEEQYQELYKHISHDFENPILWSHNKVEGTLEYTSLLYIPKKAPFDMWYGKSPKGLKLYVQRVFIMDDAEQFLPNYLRFVRGIIDSNDLPLNVSREILQDNKVIDKIRSAVTKRVIGMLGDLAKKNPEQYQDFWKEFGQVLKEGPVEDFGNRDDIAKLLRFASTHNDNDTQDVSLDDYVSRMKPEQEDIYYVTAETFSAAKNNPNLEIFRNKGIEVLLLTDRVDEWLISHMTEFGGKKLVSVAKGGLDLGKLQDEKDKDKLKELNEQNSDFINKIKESLQGRVEDVRISQRLISSPACVVCAENAMSRQMQQMMRAAGQPVPATNPILEINHEHLLMKRLQEEANQEKFNQLAELILEQAILADGGHLDNPAGFVSKFNALLLELAS